MSDNESECSKPGIKRDETINMEELIKASSHEKTINENDALEVSNNSQHGDVVETNDGEYGIVIDKLHETQKLIDAGTIKDLDKLVDEKSPVYRRIGWQYDDGVADYGAKIINKDPTSEDAISISNVKSVFENYEPTLEGLQPSGSEEATTFREAMNALKTGRYVLPTVEQYEAQKQRIKEKEDKEEKKKMETNQNNNQNAQQPPEVLDLAAMEEQISRNSHQNELVRDDTPKSAQNIQPSHVTEFYVPEGRGGEFIHSLTPEQQEKVETSKTIKVNEVRKVDVPVATRTITNISQYKRIASNRVASESVEVPLLNSGYVAIVKGCGSLEMASILPDIRNNYEWDDYAKLYQFCFSNLVGTSIGTLSYRDFCVKTSPYDLDALVHGILRASLPDEQSVTLTCGGENCGKDYDIKYSLSNLIDWDSVTDEMLQRIDEIMSVKNVIEDARRVQEASPVMTQKYIDIGNGETVCIRSQNGPLVIERTNDELITKIATNYNQIVTLFLLNIEKITVELPDETGTMQIYDLIDPEAMAAEIQTFSDTQLEIIKEELQTLKAYPQYTYSFKGPNNGPIICPHCKLENKRIPCKVQQLVFQRVSRAIN